MAKAKKTTAKASKKATPKKAEVVKEVTINLDTFAVPIAIVVAGVIIALTIFLTNRSSKNDVSDSKGANPAVDDSAQAPEGADVTVALGDDPYIGDKKKAKVAVVEYSDYQCGYCKRHSDQTFPDLKTNFVDTGKILYVFKEFPLGDSGLGYDTAIAGTCVFDQLGGEKFAEFHKSSMGAASLADVRANAISVGVDGKKYDECVAAAKFKDNIQANKAEGSKAGISGTPGFVVGKIDKDGNVTGKLIAGAYPYDTFKSTIEELLK